MNTEEKQEAVRPIHIIAPDVTEALDYHSKPRLSKPGRIRGYSPDGEDDALQLKAAHFIRLLSELPQHYRLVIVLWHGGHTVDLDLLLDAFDAVCARLDVDEIDEAA